MTRRTSGLRQRHLPHLALPFAVALSWGLGCGTPPEPVTAPAKPSKRAASEFDPCEGNPPPPKAYAGVLREARCDQEMFLTMAATAGALGVECVHCHERKPGGGERDFDYPAMTGQKQIANWMKHNFVDRLRHKDGSPVKCKSCHVDRAGKPAAKFLGTPRDRAYAMEWMNVVLVNEFTLADGGKLKCRHCHEGMPGTPAFVPGVILSENLALPPRSDLPPPGRPPELGEPAEVEPGAPPAGHEPEPGPEPASGAEPASGTRPGAGAATE